MIRIDLYAHGAGYRIRVHEHLGDDGDHCCDACVDALVERAYPPRGASPAEVRMAVQAAVSMSLRAVGHSEFVRMLHSEHSLF